MDQRTAITVFESLASGVRLDVFRLLIRTGPTGMVAGEIAAAVRLPPTNASFHLKALTQAGLLTVEQEGRYQRYRANIELMTDLIGYMTEECCAGNPQLCIPSAASPAGTRDLRAPPARTRRKAVTPRTQ